jgi:choline dehydrogenase-like flavoprotein
MSHVVVIGSGASGVHFALTLLERGHRVTMLDAGRAGAPYPHPEANYSELKERLEDPVAYLLGEKFQGVVLPDSNEEYYGIPPGKEFIFDGPAHFRPKNRGFSPLFSFAQGGLAEAWTAGCYPLNAAEMTEFPFPYEEMLAAYGTVAARIGVTGEADDLARFMPLHDGLMEPLKLDPHSQQLVELYQKKKRQLNEKLGCYVGRTRVATLSKELHGRGACSYLGRCLWGCPVGAIYTPSATLRQCERFDEFTYHGGLLAQHLELGSGGRAEAVICRSLDGSEERRFEVDDVALAAGALCSSGILLESLRRDGSSEIAFDGLMDNRQVLVPFVNQRWIGRPFQEQSYQYHLIGLGLEMPRPEHYVHGQITTLKTAMLHPIVQGLPFDLGTSTRVGRAMHAALGVVNVNFHDDRRETNRLRVETNAAGESQLMIQYAPPKDEPQRMDAALKRVRTALRKLGCWVPPGMSHVRPMGASVHYAGTVPMSHDGGEWTTDPHGRSRAIQNLYLVDGSTFPFLPAKNLTFTLMANATRIAESAF